MYRKFDRQRRGSWQSSSSGPRLGLAGAGILMLLTACGGGSSSGAAGIEAGSGQSLPGLPGSTATGAVPTPAAMPTATSAMSMPTTMGSASPAATAATVGGQAVAIKNFAFSPATLVVKIGTKVTWTNQDTDAHTVTSTGSDGPLKSAALSTGQTYSYTFTTAGSFSYLCTIHPFMTATVKVTT